MRKKEPTSKCYQIGSKPLVGGKEGEGVGAGAGAGEEGEEGEEGEKGRRNEQRGFKLLDSLFLFFLFFSFFCFFVFFFFSFFFPFFFSVVISFSGHCWHVPQVLSPSSPSSPSRSPLLFLTTYPFATPTKWGTGPLETLAGSFYFFLNCEFMAFHFFPLTDKKCFFFFFDKKKIFLFLYEGNTSLYPWTVERTSSSPGSLGNIGSILILNMFSTRKLKGSS